MRVSDSARVAPQRTETLLQSSLALGAPIAPSHTLSAPGAAQRALDSILERAKELASDSTSEEAQPPGHGGAVSGVIQRKSTKLTPVATLKDHASVFFNDSYDRIIDITEAYLDDANAPPTNYGRRMRYLVVIRRRISEWEAKNGAVDRPIRKKLFASKTDKRREVLKLLSDSLATEQTHLEKAGLKDAKQHHKTDRAKLKEYLDEGAKSPERMLRNTCEWFQLGKANLYAVTPTGDSERRLEIAGMSPGKDEAWFPKGLQGEPGDVLHAAVQYNETDLTDQTNVNLDVDGKVTGGWNVPGVVVITNPARSNKETVWETLRHEVQHDADFNKGRDAGAGVHTAGKEYDATGAGLALNSDRTGFDVTGTTAQKNAGKTKMTTYEAEVALTRYKTEYRAYSFQEGETNGPYAKLDNSLRNKAHDGQMFTERQLAIFKHIYQGYAYTKTHWDANTPLTAGRTFREAVAAYWNPDTEAFNKYNSPRVDDFYRALDEIGLKEAKSKLDKGFGRDVAPVESDKKVDALDDPGVVKLLDAIDKLTGDDADYIFNESPAMLKKIGQHLKDPALTKVKSELKDMADFSKLGSLFD